MTGDNGQMTLVRIQGVGLIRHLAFSPRGGSSLAWQPHSQGAAAAHLLLDARAAWAAGTQRRTISRLATRPAAPSRQGRGARGAAAGHVSLGSSTRGAFAAGATGTQRRPIYSFGAVLAADHLLLGISTHDARAAGAAGTQRRPISCLATQLAAPSIRVRAVAAGVQRRPMSRLVARLTESRRLRGGRGPDAAGR
eukprot:tig00020592_g11698.t3